MKKSTKIISFALVLAMFTPSVSFAEEFINAEQLPEKVSAVIAYELDRLKNTVNNISFDNFDDEVDEEDSAAEFEDPGMNLNEESVRNLYDMGYDLADIEKAEELSVLYGKTPYELLQMKGKKKYVISETSAIDSVSENMLSSDASSNNISGDNISSSGVSLDDASSDNIYANNGLSDNILLDDTSVIEERNEDISLEYDLEAEESSWDFVEADLGAEINKEISENQWSAVKTLGIEEYIDRSVLSSEELAALDSASTNSLSTTVLSGTDMTNIYNDYIFPTGMHTQITQGGYSGTGAVTVNEVTGNIVVTETDISLVGRNGLDLNLTRHYSVMDSNNLDAIVGKTTQTVTSKSCKFYSVSGNPHITIYYNEPLADGSTSQSFDGNAVYIAQNRTNYNRNGTVTDGMFVNSAAYEEDLARIQNNREPLYLFEDSDTADRYVTHAANEKYNYTITFNTGKIAKIKYDLSYNDFTRNTVKIGNKTTFTINSDKYSYYDDTDDSTNSKYFNIGAGWSFDFPYIERRKDSSNNKTYEYLHMGSSGIWQIEDDELVGYNLKDIVISSVNGTFNSETCDYLLTEKSGKKYYFGTIGQLLGIEDRYGNKILFSYDRIQNGNRYYPRLKSITDTVGRVVSIVYTGNTKVTITVTDKNDSSQNRVIEYNKTSVSGGSYVLSSVKNAVGYTTSYEYNNSEFKISMKNKNFNSDYSYITYSKLTGITYPTGMKKEIYYSKAVRNCGLEGIMELPIVSYSLDNVYDEDGNATQRNMLIYGINRGASNSNGYDGYPSFRSISEIPNEYRVYFWLRTKYDKHLDRDKDDIAIYNLSHNNTYDNAKDSSKKHWVKELQVTTAMDYLDSDPDEERDILTEITEYTYNNKEQLIKEAVRHYNDFSNNKTDYVETTKEYTYDSTDYNDIKSVKLYGESGYTTSYEYDTTYHLPTKITYKKDASTTIVNAYTLTSDKKSVAAAAVTENNSTKRKRAYTYDNYGNVISEKRYTGSNSWNDYIQINYSYDDGRSVSNKLNGVYINQISISGMKDADGNSLSDVSETISYDWYGNAITETDANGNVYGYTYDKLNRLTKVINPNASTMEYTFTVNENANDVLVKDANGNIMKYSYDAFGEEASVTNVSTNTLLSDRRRLKDQTRGYLIIKDNEYSSQNGVISTKTYYNCLGQECSKEILDLSGNVLYSEKMDYEYAVDGMLSKVTKTVYGDSDSEAVSTSSYTDKYGNIVKEEVLYNEGDSAKIAVTEYAYDFLGNLKTVREPRAKAENWSADLYTARYEYDTAGNVTKETDITGNSITNTYDGLGNLVSVTDKNGNTTINTYDALGRLLKEQTPFQASGTSIIYASNKYYYDGNGNVTKVQKANNAAGSSDAYTRTDYTYNWQNQPTKVQEYNGSSVSNCVQYYYDNNGNILRQYTGYINNLVINGLDSLSGNTSNYAVTKYTYDSMNRCTSETDGLGQVTSHMYDINGNLVQTNDRNGNVLGYSYDGLNRLTQKDSSSEAGDIYTYTYNKKGRTSMSGGGVNTTYEYDNLGRLTKESLTNGTVKEYTYDVNGNRKSFKLTKDNTVQYTLTYSYDKMNRLIGMFEDGTLKVQYAYNADGTLRRSLSGTRITDYTYNLANMVTEVNNRKSTTQISDYTYTYYVDGNQKSKTESVGGVDKGTTSYTYDGLGRLKKESYSDSTYKLYNYDYYGNRSSQYTSTDGNTSYVYDKNNRLTKQTRTYNGVSYITEYWYDPNGNQISSMSVNTSLKSGSTTVKTGLAGSSGTSTISSYDSWNRLKSTSQNGKTASYTYNGDGLRMSKTVGGVTTSHIWDGTNIAADVTNGTVTKYIRGLRLISSKTGGSENFYNYNGHGDVVQLTNSSGNITKQYNYDAFGVEQDKVSSDTNPFRYCGEYYDKETDNIYLRARYYAPLQGRFTTEDPAEDGLNWYSYCGGNPVAFVDPWGLAVFTGSGTLKIGENEYTLEDSSISVNLDIIPWEDKVVSERLLKSAQMNKGNKIGNYPFVPQEAYDICWAAVISQAVDYFTGKSFDKMEIAKQRLDGKEDFASSYGGLSDIAEMFEKNEYLKGSGYEVNSEIKALGTSNHMYDSISINEMKQNIDQQLPILLSWGNHVVTVIGYRYNDYIDDLELIYYDTNNIKPFANKIMYNHCDGKLALTFNKSIQ